MAGPVARSRREPYSVVLRWQVIVSIMELMIQDVARAYGRMRVDPVLVREPSDAEPSPNGHDNAYAASPAHELVKRSRPLKYSLYRVSSRASAPLVPPVKLAIPYFLVIGIWDSARRESAERLASETELL